MTPAASTTAEGAYAVLICGMVCPTVWWFRGEGGGRCTHDAMCEIMVPWVASAIVVRCVCVMLRVGARTERRAALLRGLRCRNHPPSSTARHHQNAPENTITRHHLWNFDSTLVYCLSVQMHTDVQTSQRLLCVNVVGKSPTGIQWRLRVLHSGIVMQ